MSKKNNAFNNEFDGQFSKIDEEEILTNENDEILDDNDFDGTDEDADTMKSIDGILFDDFERKLAEDESIIDIEPELPSDAKITLEQAVQDYQVGTYEAFDYLFNYYKPIFDRVGYRHNDEDLAQELSVVLYRAALTFDINGGAKFNTYYWKCARNHMGTLRIRKNAKKRTAEHGIVSIQQSFNTKDSDVEIGAFIEDPDCDKTYNNKIFQLVLEEKVYPFLKNDEVKAMKMIMNGFTLEDIGRELGGITAPAVHVKFRRLANKKNVGKQLQELYQLFGS
jgi:DNA-directed RNA polymerase specialized sigma24 family protein